MFFSEATQAGELANLTWRKDNWLSIFIANIHFKIFCNQLRISFNRLKIFCNQSIKDGNICLQVELSHRLDVHWYLVIIIIIIMALAQIPISTFSHIWVFVRQYGIMFVIIVIIIIIIIIYRKVKVSTLKHV